MISSMTGYGRAEGQTTVGHLVVEIKSVNHRFLDSRVRLPRQYSSLEPQILTYMKNCIARGRVEVNLTLTSCTNSGGSPILNLPLAHQYLEATRNAAQSLGMPSQVSLEFVLRMPEVLQVMDSTIDIDTAWEEILPVLEAAVQSLGDMRAREGQALAVDFRQTLSELEQHRQELEKLKSRVVEEYREKLQNRLKALLVESGGIDPGRLHQEVALFADRADISEELARLKSHFEQFDGILVSPQPAGRKLDFLLQEMFREINTIGSKASHIDITRHVLDMKNLIERLREQVQNVE